MNFSYRVKNAVLGFLQSSLRRVRLDVFARKPGYHYAPDYFGRSSHKQTDIRNLPLFGELAERVIRDGRVSLYYDRLFTVYQVLSSWHLRTGASEILNTVEVGVYKGGTSYFIALLAERLGLPVRHFCFDTFEGHAAEDINAEVDTWHIPKAFDDTNFEAVKEYLKRFGNVSVHKGRFQNSTDFISDRKMHFVHLDMDIYEPTLFALQFLRDRMVRGGVILLDDYGFETCPGIEKAVHEFLSANQDYFGMALLGGQFILIKI